MRPRFSLWSDHGAPAQRQWKSPSKRGVSIGPKILLAAIVVVAGFIGIGGIFPQVIDRWIPDAGPGLPVMSLSAPDARTKALDVVATASPSRRVITTGEGTLLPPRPLRTRDTAPSERAAPEAPRTATPMGATEVPESQTKADALLAEAAPAPAARAAEQTKSTRMAQRGKPVVKKVVHFAQRRSSHRDYAQSNGWGWPSSGWGSWGGWGGGYRF
jgi:hypothetical protein